MTESASDTTSGVHIGSTGTGAGGSDGNTNTSGAPGNGAPLNGSGDGSGGSAAWYGSVKDADLRAYAEKKNWSDVDSVLKSNRELETKLSQRPEAPVIPKDVSEYKFNKPTDLPDGAYNEKFASSFASWAMAAGVPVEAAGKIHDAFVGWAKETMGAQATAAGEALGTKIRAAGTALEQDWGKSETPGFKKNAEMARRAIRNADPELRQSLIDSGVLIVGADGKEMVGNAPIMKALAKLGASAYAEDSLYGTPTGSEKNPFADATADLAMQGRLIQNEPDKAVELIKMAGKQKMYSQFLSRHAARK